MINIISEIEYTTNILHLQHSLFFKQFYVGFFKINANLHILCSLTTCEATFIFHLNQAFCSDLYVYQICLFVKYMDFDLMNKQVQMKQIIYL